MQFPDPDPAALSDYDFDQSYIATIAITIVTIASFIAILFSVKPEQVAKGVKAAKFICGGVWPPGC